MFCLGSACGRSGRFNNRIRTLTTRFETFQQRPDGGVPAETLRKAQGIILLDRTKAGFIFAFQGGGGVAMVRDAKLGKWSPVAFLSANQASLGVQVGGERSFYIILMMTPDATRMLTDPRYEFGGEARGTAGATTTGVQGTVSPANTPPVIIYDDRQGLYGGAAIKAGSISPDDKANSTYYGQAVTMRDILFGHKVHPTETAVELAKQIDSHAQK